MEKSRIIDLEYKAKQSVKQLSHSLIFHNDSESIISIKQNEQQ